MTKTLGVIGGGVLGRAVARGFLEHLEVKVFDTIKERATHSLEEAATCDIVMICLPTPAKLDGRCDTKAIDDFLDVAFTHEWWRPDSCYVIRSTTPVGYTQDQAHSTDFERPLLHSPESLTARCALTDFQIPARNIIGMPGKGHWMPASPVIYEAFKRLKSVYENRFPGVPVLDMDARESELVKLACNSFFAAKVTLFNLFAEMAKAKDLDWETVRAGILSDGRIAHAHTAVPGPSGERGYAGSCLDKDLADLYRCCEDAAVDAEILRQVLERNKLTRSEAGLKTAEISLF